jgi:hypothetical protein
MSSPVAAVFCTSMNESPPRRTSRPPRSPLAVSSLPSDPDYLLAFGRAVYTWTYLEAQAIAIVIDLDPARAEPLRTARRDALCADLKHVASTAPAPAFALLTAFAVKFEGVVERRRDLIHARPYRANGSVQQLGRATEQHAWEWPKHELLAAAREFELLAIEGNDIYYKALPRFVSF